MKKILIQGDSPLAQTGFGRVMNEIVNRLDGKFIIDIVGVNQSLSVLSPKYPYKTTYIHGNLSLMDDPQGYRYFSQMLAHKKYDYIFILNDYGVAFNHLSNYIKLILEGKIGRSKVFLYAPQDTSYFYSTFGQMQVGDTTISMFDFIDKVFCYTNFQKKLLTDKIANIENKVEVIYHGTNTNVFKPVSRQIKKQVREKLKIDKDDFFIINVNRNQWRKDLASTVLVYYVYKALYPEDKVKLYIHAKPNDVGGNLNAIIDACFTYTKKFYKDLEVDEENAIRLLPATHNVGTGIPVEHLNAIYNTADLLISTSVGEGWGLSTTEAMAVGTPVFVPRHTSNLEIVGENEDRGYLAEVGERFDNMQISYGNSEFFRPKVKIEAMAKKLKHIYDNRGEAKLKAQKAKEWIENETTWDKTLPKLINEFKK